MAAIHRLSMSQLSTFRWSLADDVEKYAAAGYRAIGIWRRKLSDAGEQAALSAIRHCGLSVSCLMWAGGFTGSGGMSFQDGVEDAMEAIRLTAALGAPCLVVYSGGRNNHILSQAWRLFHEAISRLLPLAEVLDVKLAVEPMHPASAAEWTFITSVPAALSAIDEYDSPHLTLALDTYHFGLDDDAIDQVAEAPERLAIVHVADRKKPPQEDQDRVVLGEGCIPLASVVQRLEAAGYEGYYDVKLVGPEITPDEYGRVLADSRSVLLATLAQSQP